MERYWVYVHDEDDEMVFEEGDFETLNDAIEYVSTILPLENDSHTVRIVLTSNTVWKAGPVD